MFEDSTSRSGFVEFAQDFISLSNAYPATAVIYLGSIPFWIYSWRKRWRSDTVPSFPLHAYFLTAVFCIENPLRVAKRDLREKWFWTAAVFALVSHAIILICLCYWDHIVPGRTTLYSNPLVWRLIIACSLELWILDAIFRYFRPSPASGR